MCKNLQTFLLICSCLLVNKAYSASDKFVRNEVKVQTMVLGSEAKKYKLQYYVPKDWEVVYNHNTAGGSITEYLPKGQKLESWKDMISMQLQGVAVPSDYAYMHQIFLKGPLNKQTCKNFKISNFTDYSQSGLKTVEYFIECPELINTPGTGEVMFFKYLLAGDKVGLLSTWRSWKINNDLDLKKAREGYEYARSLFRQVSLNEI